MDHPLLMDDFDDDITSTKSVSEEDLFETVKEGKDKSKKPPSRKISEFSSGDEQEPIELTSVDKNRSKSSSSPIEIKGSPARGLHSRASTDSKGSPRSGSSVESTGNGNSKLSIFRVLTRRTSNQGKHKKNMWRPWEQIGGQQNRTGQNPTPELGHSTPNVEPSSKMPNVQVASTSTLNVPTSQVSGPSSLPTDNLDVELQDNWIQAREPVLDGVTFCVKFLGSTLIDKTGASDAAEATKTVIQMVKAGQKTNRVGLKVSTTGITLLEPNTGETRLEISIYDIAHCSTDSSFPNVFSFIATNKNDVNECYCFATRKRKMAQQITLTIAQSFNLAFEIWQNSSLEKDTSDHFGPENVRVIIGSTDSSQSCTSSASSNANPVEDIRSGQWVHFDEVDEITDAINSFNMVALAAPFSNPEKSRSSRVQQSNISDNEDLLICLN